MRARTDNPTLTNTEIAQRVGIHHSTVSCYRAGKRVPTMTILNDIFDEFKVSRPARTKLVTALMSKTTKEERREIFAAWFNSNIANKTSKAA